jgi:hypothetical protein
MSPVRGTYDADYPAIPTPVRRPYKPGETVRVLVNEPGQSYIWVARIVAPRRRGYTVVALDPGLGSHPVGDLVEVRDDQLQPVTCSTVGDLANLDFFAHPLIPCKVLEVRRESGRYGTQLSVRLTANRSIYRRGQVMDVRADHCVPRRSIRVRDGRYLIRNDYTWLPPEVLRLYS